VGNESEVAMQCDVCSEAAIVQVTEVAAGKPSDRWFCERHAEANGRPTQEEWKSFWASLLPVLKKDGTMPPLAEISRHGIVGSWVGKVVQRSGPRFMQQLEAKARQLLTN
jgi:hypothetical protein